MRRLSACIVSTLAFLAFVAPPVLAAPPTAEIIIEAMWPQKIHDLHLPGPDTTTVTDGLPVVGAGTNAYLRAGGTDPDKGKITGSSWSLASSPSGSAATLTSGPAEGLQTLSTDVVGEYTVQLTVIDDQGETSAPVTRVITAANYVGVGTVPGYVTPDMSKGQCGACHNGTLKEDKVTTWLETPHATKVTRAIDGKQSASYKASCIRCHTVGWNDRADNGGFDDVARAIGWTFPAKLQEGNWAAMPNELKNLANIQCENCHGPGSLHFGNKAKIAYSYSSDLCNRCHAQLNSHPRGVQIQNSGHNRSLQAYSGVATGLGPSSNSLNGCGIQCHSAQGFVEFTVDGEPIDRNLYSGRASEAAPVSCQTCHDPHEKSSEYQLRLSGEVTLPGTDVTIDAGPAAACFKCHTNYTPGFESLISTNPDQGGGPYHHQGPMFAGVGGYEYPGENYENGAHTVATPDKCVTCHMSTYLRTEPGFTTIGNHTWSMRDDRGTPSDTSDDLLNTRGCEQCHGPIADFNVNGAQDRVQDALNRLAGMLPKDSRGRPLPASNDSVKLTDSQRRAAFNWAFVSRDGSKGVHNHRYAEKLLRDAILDLGGQIVTNVEADASRSGLPATYALAQNEPNPFNPETSIRYSVAKPAMVRLTVYDMAGQKVIDLVNRYQASGAYLVRWDGKNDVGVRVATGVYLYQLAAGDFRQTKRMALMR